MQTKREWRFVRVTLGSLGLVIGAGCAPPIASEDAGTPSMRGDAGTAPRPDAGTSSEPEGGPDGGASDDAGRGISSSAVKPNVLLLVDRSGSMAEPSDCGEDTCPSKWDQLRGLGVYLEEAKGLARLGLAMFPSPEEGSCSVRSSLRVPLTDDPDVDEQILAEATRVRPGGSTPVAAALDEMGRVGGLDDPERDNILLVLTDGQPNCACSVGETLCERNEAVAAVERIAGREVPVDVDIIGFGASAREADETLTAMAEAAGDERYYQSDTIEELVSTLYDVAVANVPCTFELDGAPEPERLVVWKDGEEVSACSTDPCEAGYTYDEMAKTVELHGSTCSALRDGEDHDVWFDERSS